MYLKCHLSAGIVEPQQKIWGKKNIIHLKRSFFYDELVLFSLFLKQFGAFVVPRSQW